MRQLAHTRLHEKNVSKTPIAYPRKGMMLFFVPPTNKAEAVSVRGTREGLSYKVLIRFRIYALNSTASQDGRQQSGVDGSQHCEDKGKYIISKTLQEIDKSKQDKAHAPYGGYNKPRVVGWG